MQLYYNPHQRIYLRAFEQSGGLTYFQIVKSNNDRFRVGQRIVYAKDQLRRFRKIDVSDPEYMEFALNKTTLDKIAADVAKVT